MSSLQHASVSAMSCASMSSSSFPLSASTDTSLVTLLVTRMASSSLFVIASALSYTGRVYSLRNALSSALLPLLSSAIISGVMLLANFTPPSVCTKPDYNIPENDKLFHSLSQLISIAGFYAV